MIRYPPLDVLSDGAAHGAEHLVHLVQDHGGGIVAEVVESRANLCDLVLVAWAVGQYRRVLKAELVKRFAWCRPSLFVTFASINVVTNG